MGKPLQRELSGIYSARRGTYRVLYRINEERREVIVLHVQHRRGGLSSAMRETDAFVAVAFERRVT